MVWYICTFILTRDNFFVIIISNVAKKYQRSWFIMFKNPKCSLHDIGVFIGLGNAYMVRVARSGMKDDANPGLQSNTQQLLSSI